MSNTTLTADVIAAEALEILEGELVMANLVHRAHESEFSKTVNGYTVGETISIRRPTDFTVRDGRVATAQDVVEVLEVSLHAVRDVHVHELARHRSEALEPRRARRCP